MRRSGVKVLLFGLCASILAFGIISVGSYYDHTFRGQTVRIWLTIVLLCPFVYQILGTEWLLGIKRRQGSAWLSTFDATQGLGNDSLIAVKLAVLMTSVFVSWLAMACAAVAQTVLWGNTQNWDRFHEMIAPIAADVPGVWWAVAVVIAIVIYASNSALVVTIGYWLPLYAKVLFVAKVVIFAHIFLAFWDSKHAWALHLLWSAYGWLLPVVIVCVTIFALRKALQSGYLNRQGFVVALCAWTVFALATTALYLKVLPASVTVPPSAFAMGFAMLIIPLATVAIAPLSLASLRHR